MQFECSPGECIPKSWVCDIQLDCMNGLDEKNCSKLPMIASGCVQTAVREQLAIRWT